MDTLLYIIRKKKFPEICQFLTHHDELHSDCLIEMLFPEIDSTSRSFQETAVILFIIELKMRNMTKYGLSKSEASFMLSEHPASYRHAFLIILNKFEVDKISLTRHLIRFDKFWNFFLDLKESLLSHNIGSAFGSDLVWHIIGFLV